MRPLLLFLAVACLHLPAAAAGSLSDQDLATAARLRDAALAGTGAWDTVASLTTEDLDATGRVRPQAPAAVAGGSSSR